MTAAACSLSPWTKIAFPCQQQLLRHAQCVLSLTLQMVAPAFLQLFSNGWCRLKACIQACRYYSCLQCVLARSSAMQSCTVGPGAY